MLSPYTMAHALIDALMVFGSSFTALIVPLRIWLPLMATAAYDAPPSATNKASRAMAFWRMKVRILSTGRVSPYWVLGAPRPGPRLPFCPKAFWLDWALAACAPLLLTICEPVDDAELDPL